MIPNFDSLFPDTREEGLTPLKQTQLVMLRLLKIFDDLCRRHNIDYFLVGGSCIGAVRHKGFIPWDDDIDIGMTRDNYNLFVEKCVGLLPNDIFFQNHKTDKYYPELDYVDAKLRDKYSSYKHKNNNIKYHDGLQLDIFVFDQAFLSNKYFIIFQNLIVNKISKHFKIEREKVLSNIKKFSPWKTVYSSNWLQKIGMTKRSFGAIFYKEHEIQKLIEVEFEDSTFFIPQFYDSILRRQYGEYMKLPPEDKQVSHHDVKVRPFTPCEHEQILHWKDRI
jgi:lipopolysaccharide cholinephosphotransferase